MVFFAFPECGACRLLTAVLEEGQWQGPSLFEVDAQRDLALTREFEVFHLPAMFLFRDGCFHCELHAGAHPARLNTVAQAHSQPAREAP